MSLIEAFLLDQTSEFKRLIPMSAKDDTTSSYLNLLGRFLEMKEREDGHLLYSAIEAEVHEAIKNPPEDPKIFAMLISAFMFFYVYSPQRYSAAGLLSYLERYEKEDLESDHYILIQFIKWIFHRIHRHYAEELEFIDNIIARIKSKGSPLWLLAKTNQIESTLLHQDWIRAKKELSELEPFRASHPWYGLGPYEFMNAWLAFGQGKNEEALSFVESYPSGKMGRCKTRFFIYQIRTLINLEHIGEAEKLLDNAKINLHETTAATLALHRNLTTADYENLRGFLELAKRNFNEARSHAQQSIKIIHSNTLQSDGTLTPGFSNAYGKFCLLFVELATKQARAARLLLQVLDPRQEKHLFEWARLHLLEGNRDQAMFLFKKFMTKTPQALESKLQFAFELSAALVASIFTHLPSISKKDVSPPTTHKKILNLTLISSAFIGNSPKIQDVRNKIDQFAPLNSTILISGETGCGKDVVARLLHQSGAQASEPFIPVNCGALSETLIESELFGHVKGAFTGANSDHEGIFLAAGKGTVFLDEVSSMSPHLQASLLRVLENQEIRPVGSNKIHRVKARIIVATNEPLDRAVADKKFRMDLYFRLAHFHIHIPPLRERREDIPLLAEYFLKKFYAEIPIMIGSDLLEALKRYDWPGNVRELKNEMERIAFLAGDSQTLDASLFQHDENQRPSFFSTSSAISIPPPSRSQITGEKVNYAAYRLQRLRDLFNEHPKLSRLDVIRLLQYAPATVAKDLKILEQEKWIQRVNTSAHPRTSYFVKC